MYAYSTQGENWNKDPVSHRLLLSLLLIDLMYKYTHYYLSKTYATTCLIFFSSLDRAFPWVTSRHPSPKMSIIRKSKVLYILHKFKVTCKRKLWRARARARERERERERESRKRTIEIYNQDGLKSYIWFCQRIPKDVFTV